MGEKIWEVISMTEDLEICHIPIEETILSINKWECVVYPLPNSN